MWDWSLCCRCFQWSLASLLKILEETFEEGRNCPRCHFVWRSTATLKSVKPAAQARQGWARRRGREPAFLVVTVDTRNRTGDSAPQAYKYRTI